MLSSFEIKRELKQRITLSSALTYRRPIRHAPPDADDLPGVRAEPSLLAASPHRVQAEPAFRSAVDEAGEQAGLPEPVTGNLPDVPDASGMLT